MLVKAKVAFFTDDYKCVGHNETVDLSDKLAKKLLECDYVSLVEDVVDEIPKKKPTTKKKKAEVE